MPRMIKYWKCLHSGCSLKAKASKSYVVKHELDCWHNPVNKTCCTCQHSEEHQESGLYSMPDGSVGEAVIGLHRECNHPDGSKIIGEPERLGQNVKRDKPQVNCAGWVEREIESLVEAEL